VTIKNVGTYQVPVEYVVVSGYIENDDTSIIWASIEKMVEYENEYPNLIFHLFEEATKFSKEFFIEIAKTNTYKDNL